MGRKSAGSEFVSNFRTAAEIDLGGGEIHTPDLGVDPGIAVTGKKSWFTVMLGPGQKQTKIRFFEAKLRFALSTPFAYVNLEPKRSETKEEIKTKERNEALLQKSLFGFLTRSFASRFCRGFLSSPLKSCGF